MRWRRCVSPLVRSTESAGGLSLSCALRMPRFDGRPAAFLNCHLELSLGAHCSPLSSSSRRFANGLCRSGASSPPAPPPRSTTGPGSACIGDEWQREQHLFLYHLDHRQSLGITQDRLEPPPAPHPRPCASTTSGAASSIVHLAGLEATLTAQHHRSRDTRINGGPALEQAEAQLTVRPRAFERAGVDQPRQLREHVHRARSTPLALPVPAR